MYKREQHPRKLQSDNVTVLTLGKQVLKLGHLSLGVSMTGVLKVSDSSPIV